MHARGTTKPGVNSESPTAPKPRLLADLWEANPAMAPKRVPFFREKSHKRFTLIVSIAKFNLPFSRKNTDPAIHLCSNQFIFETLCFAVTLLRNAICYISFHLALKFNIEIY